MEEKDVALEGLASQVSRQEPSRTLLFVLVTFASLFLMWLGVKRNCSEMKIRRICVKSSFF